VDIVGEVVTAVRTGRPIARRTDLYGTWGLRFRGDQGAGFHVVLEGSAWIVPPIVSAPVRLGVGDVVFVGKADGYTLADHPGAPLQDVDSTAPKEQWPIPAPLPGERPGAVLLCGTYALEQARPHPLIAQLPKVIHLPARATIGEPLRSVVDLLGAEVQRDGASLSAAVPALLDLLIIYTLRVWYAREAERGAQGWARALQDRAVRTALENIQQSPATPWTVAQLAAAGSIQDGVCPPVPHTRRRAAADLSDPLADDHRGASAPRNRLAHRIRRGAGRLRVAVRLRKGVQAING
jgi:Cupin